MVGMLWAAISAVTALAAQPSPPAFPDADPAIWVIRDSDTTIYMFGTFHALDGRSEWFNGPVQAAFARSDELVLETLLPKLDSKPVPAEIQRSRGYSVTPSASFLGATRMAASVGRQRGLDVRKGADMVLRNAAEETGKKVGALESIEFQLGMLSRMAGPGGRPGAPMQMDEEAKARAAAIMAEMQAAWNRGDQGIFTALLDQMRRSSPDNYRVMFPERNAHWADWIGHRLEAPGTIFVAVGAGHFAGPDSVLAKLSSRGLVPIRIN